MLIEILRDHELHQRVLEEVQTEFIVDAKTGRTHLDRTKLNSLQLLNSIFLECLRLRASIPAMRRIRRDIGVGGYVLRAGNYVVDGGCR